MKNKNNSAGFGVVEIIMVVIVLLLVFVGVWYVFQKNQSKQNTSQSQTTPNAPKILTNQEKTNIPTQSSANIPAWSINAKNASTLTIQYVINSDNVHMHLTSAELASLVPVGCNIAGQNGNFSGPWWIDRYAVNSNVDRGPAQSSVKASDVAAAIDKSGYYSPYSFYKKVGDYYYFFGHPQNGCSFGQPNPPAELAGTETKTGQAIKDFISSFAAQ